MKRQLLILVASCLAAQARVTLLLRRPPAGRLGAADLWHVQVHNPDSVLHGRLFQGEVTESKTGRVFRATTWPLDVPVGKKTYRLADVRVRGQTAMPGYEAFLSRTGELPAGEYSYRIVLMPDNVGDGYEVRIEKPNPPRLLSPRDEENVTAELPQFRWTRPLRSQRAATYRIRVTEVLKGQTAEDAVNKNRSWFEESGLNRVDIRFPVSARRFEKGMRYAWQVEAMSDGKVLAQSEANGFWYRQPPELMCGCRIDSICIGDVFVHIGTTYGFTGRGRPEIEFFTSCEDGGCGITGHHWRVTEQDNHNCIVGAGNGNQLVVPPLGVPRSLAVFVSVHCLCGKTTTRAFTLNIGP